MSADDRFMEQIQGASVPIYLTEKADIIEYYMSEYGDEDWKSELVDALGEVTDLKRSSLMRRFQGGREYSTRVSAKAREEYRQVGEQIGPVDYEPPAGGYKITFVGEIRISKKCYPRHFVVHMGGDEAMEFAQVAAGEGDINDLWELIFYEYFEDDTAEGYCGDPVIVVEAV